MTCCIQIGCCEQIGQWIVVYVHIKGQTIQVFMECFDYHPLEGEKFQLVYWVVGLSLAQAPTGLGYYSICAILMGLIENSYQTRPIDISVEPERLGKICIGKNRCSGTQSFQVIIGLLAFAAPLDGSLFLPAFSPALIHARVGLPAWI